jgi:uncharacterized membrane protein
MKIAASLLLLAGALFLLRFALKRPSSNFAVFSGGCLALATWATPLALAAAPLLAAPLLDRRWPLRARAHLTASGLLGLGLLLLPWALARV